MFHLSSFIFYISYFPYCYQCCGENIYRLSPIPYHSLLPLTHWLRVCLFHVVSVPRSLRYWRAWNQYSALGFQSNVSYFRPLSMKVECHSCNVSLGFGEDVCFLIWFNLWNYIHDQVMIKASSFHISLKSSTMPSNLEIRTFVWGWEMETFSLCFCNVHFEALQFIKVCGFLLSFLKSKMKRISLNKFGNSVFLLFL